MARTLHFNNQQIGDHVVTIDPDHQPLTPAVRQAGVFQSLGLINIESRNLLYAFEFAISVVRNSPELAVQGIGDAQALVNTRGLLQVKVDSVVKIQCTDWVLVGVGRPELAAGFGGRFTPAWPLRFEGETAPAFA